MNCQVARVRLKVQTAQPRQRVALLAEEIRIKDARMARIPAQKRPHYLPAGRMSFLEVRAAHVWSMQQTANSLLYRRPPSHPGCNGLTSRLVETRRVGHRGPLLAVLLRLMFRLTRRFSTSPVLGRWFGSCDYNKLPAQARVDHHTNDAEVWVYDLPHKSSSRLSVRHMAHRAVMHATCGQRSH